MPPGNITVRGLEAKEWIRRFEALDGIVDSWVIVDAGGPVSTSGRISDAEGHVVLVDRHVGLGKVDADRAVATLVHKPYVGPLQKAPPKYGSIHWRYGVIKDGTSTSSVLGELKREEADRQARAAAAALERLEV